MMAGNRESHIGGPRVNGEFSSKQMIVAYCIMEMEGTAFLMTKDSDKDCSMSDNISTTETTSTWTTI